MGSMAGGGRDLLTVTLTHSPPSKKKETTKKTADKHTVVDIHKEAFTVFSPLFLSLSIVERPVVIMSLWTPGGERMDGRVRPYKVGGGQAEVACCVDG